ncbi:carbohydrate ABC transporter permease [Streptomyces sp. Ncost-T10-10d]|uniref:carbohydrate ABC transporter permease n=1 Tax=Streptomyces sp. Ncost-T10-10d TaxID=1839774 RepID=UPI00081DFBFD|nr:carbohydrate ABC transporter permease [Streptomyces sp. Ncost-T10-10d]SCF95775.1 carbohydrate ABC transporter membrane protein 2, CUT1 family [Streptomyces sp. Ncost-T10-10d]
MKASSAVLERTGRDAARDSGPSPRTSLLSIRPAKSAGVNLLCFAIAAVLFAVPLVYMLIQGFKTYTGFLQDPTGLPHPWTTDSFSTAWDQGHFGRQMINSLIYAVVPDTVTLILGVFLAFPISRGYFKRSNALYTFFIFSGFLPGGLIPLFIEAQSLHLYNSMAGYLILTSLSGAGFFFFVGYIKGIPREIDEAAALDGCGYVRFIFTIIIPQMKPALAAFAIFGFVHAWNNLILPLVMLSDSALWPVTRGLYSFFGEYTQNWPLIAAGTFIVAAPILILFVLLQRYLVEGVAGGAALGTQGVTGAAAVQAEEGDGS